MGGHDLTHSVKSFSLSHFRSRFDRILLPGQTGGSRKFFFITSTCASNV